MKIVILFQASLYRDTQSVKKALITNLRGVVHCSPLQWICQCFTLDE